MRILLIANTREDYLQDTIIHGFKELLGTEAYDHPTKQILYDDYADLTFIRGNGFTLYGLVDSHLKSSDIDIVDAIKKNYFNAIIFTSIFRQYELFYDLFKILKKQKSKVLIFDGEDTDKIFPYLGMFLKSSLFGLAPKPHKHFIYFKRELTENTSKGYLHRILPSFIADKLTVAKKLHPISFSIPSEKVVKEIPVKTKKFTTHIVDEEVATQLKVGKTAYAFSSEKEYYQDIQQSKFGITTKRAGWDCLRHYEIAANGTVICFKDLAKKPEHCAPHGLIDGYNCISYENYNDLTHKIDNLSEEDYRVILENSMNWIRSNTTIESAKKIISTYL